MERGFIVRWFLFAVVVLALAYYFFDWSIFDALESERGVATVAYIKKVLAAVWEYIKIPFEYIAEKI